MQNLQLTNPFDRSTELGRDRAANWDRQHGRSASVAAPPAVTNPQEARAQAIRETCALAGKPERAAGFISSGMAEAEVLSELRSEQPRPWSEIIAKIEGRA